MSERKKGLKQSADPNAFFDKYEFTLSKTMPHPEHDDLMEFEGLEADYVCALERKVTDLEKYIRLQNDKIEWLMNRDFYAVKKGLEK